MNKKLIIIYLFLLLFSFSLFSCANNDVNNENNNSEAISETICEHIMNKVKVKAATCIEDGHSAYYECELCGYSEEYEIIPALGHDYKLYMGKKATITEDGYTDYYECERCGDIKDKEIIKAFNHVHDSEIVNVVKETSESCGYIEYKCKICNYDYIEYNNILDRKEIFMNDVKILMVGNSFTNYNTLIELMNEMFESEGFNISVSKFSYGSQYLYDYIEGEQGDYYEQLVKFMKGKSFDVVFLQEQSNNAITNPEDFYNSVRILTKYFEDFGSKVALYETWSYRNGYKNWTYKEMYEGISNSYNTIASELNLKVSHCGKAFYYMYLNHNNMNMNNTDDSHPSTLGTYLVALTHYATITGRSPIGIKYTYNDYLKNENITWHSQNERLEITSDEQRYLEEAAQYAVFPE